VPAELLDLGADDYVRKGTPSNELLARIRAVVRRRGALNHSPSAPGSRSGTASARGGAWRLDLPRHEITWQGRAVPATAIEFRLLALLVERLGEVVPHAELLAAGWPDVPDPDPLWLKPHLARLRDKLREIGAPPPAAVRAVGYRVNGAE
jgi:two-component system, OmpR family, response regulator RegX3